MSAIDRLAEREKRAVERLKAIRSDRRAAEARQREADRRADNRRKILIGALIQYKIRNGEMNEAALLKELDSYLQLPAGHNSDRAVRNKNAERALFGLPPLEM